jgi:hypothetical protein
MGDPFCDTVANAGIRHGIIATPLIMKVMQVSK